MPYAVVVVVVNDIERARVIRASFETELTDVGRVVGVYKLPRKDEVEVCSGRCGKNAWTRDEWGVWVHACGRRMPDWRRRIRGALLDVLGINLLPRESTPALFQNPDGWDNRPTEKRAPAAETGTRRRKVRR